MLFPSAAHICKNDQSGKYITEIPFHLVLSEKTAHSENLWDYLLNSLLPNSTSSTGLSGFISSDAKKNFSTYFWWKARTKTKRFYDLGFHSH